MMPRVADGAGLELASPGGGNRLSVAGDDVLVGTSGQRFERHNGIWRILDPARVEEMTEFTDAYARVRAAEGRGSNSAEYYRALPHEDLSGRLESEWAQRADSFDRLVAGLAELGRTGVLVDVGAGNCWLAALMTARGWTALAVDINSDGHDGLGAAHHHGQDFCVAQATMEAQPMADQSADVVVFNASIHYSRDVLEALQESLRILRPEGTVVVMDSPVYRDPEAGRRMVAEAASQFEAELGVPAAPLAGPGFVTDGDLAEAADRFGLEWRHVGQKGGGPLRAFKGRLARARAGRELARRPILFGTLT